MEHVRAQVAFGPRPSGSEALEKCRTYIVGQLKSCGYAIELDEFEAETPYGPKKMKNLIARKGPADRDAIVLASHYETKLMERIRFVGANDPGSSVALLLELARVLAEREEKLDYWFIFLDGEEAFVEWSTFDSTYGSRHLAQRWKRDGTARRIRALILLDMLGDRDLDILKEGHSTRWLSDLVWETARRIGLDGILSMYEGMIEDDHIPFLDVGMSAVDIIDLNYGPGNSFHHTEADSLDKISPESMEKAGRLVLAVLDALQKR
ncbi:MAG: M28 family peptidase [Acidobacteria bacterium]|nr:M28 family peptidase [Acidobacteriota bacterium]